MNRRRFLALLSALPVAFVPQVTRARGPINLKLSTAPSDIRSDIKYAVLAQAANQLVLVTAGETILPTKKAF